MIGWTTAIALAMPIHVVPAVADASPWAFAGPKKVTPADAAKKRSEAQALGRNLANADSAAAGMHYDARGAEWGDPVLFLDAADAYLDAADKKRDIAMAEAGIERARISLDILYFHLDPAADKNFRMVDTADIADLIARANIAIDRGERLMEEIASASAAAPVASADDDAKKKKKRKKRAPGNGKGLYIGGAIAASLGGALAVLGIAGLGIGAANQRKAEDPTVYGEEYDVVEDKGRRGNVIAGVGLGLGGAFLVAGIVMVVIGKKRMNKAAPQQEVSARTRPRREAKAGRSVVRVAPTLNGVAISGRF
ncbi:MAG TPA: hypothetical protein VFG69_03950 [Nannocystaceae bacterium]|nr:hypothetical protein [Nannocystaceae bacterium]